MRKPLWMPSKESINRANITRFMDYVNKTYGQNTGTYSDLHKWSVDNIPEFWAAVWEFTGIKASRKYDKVVENLDRFPGAEWFPGARLNFAENLLRYRDEQQAFIFRGEDRKASSMTYAELYNAVARLAKSLREMGIVAGDRVGAYMPNLMETAIAMLAVTSIGAVWSSCGTELGAGAVVDRLGQIGPKVLFTVDAQLYKGKAVDLLPNVERIAKEIPSLERVIVTPYVSQQPEIGNIKNAVLFDDFLSKGTLEIKFEQLPFDHPVLIMFSSGTTGKPKCMVQGPGVLINLAKELIIQSDLKREDKIFYITTPSWMMWNWLIGSLTAGATIVLYDGNPNYPDWGTMWRLVEETGITIFGCSASYINYLRSVEASPAKTYDLSSLREISQTGSALSAEGFKYIYKKIKKNLHFNSIAGGTDINGCFAIGSPIQPVYAGELQSPGLGMKVSAFDDAGKCVLDEEGELVCESPSPSMPLYFWNDPDSARYRSTYFDVYPGVWRHGDLVFVHGDTGGITYLGRSDFTLKPSGVRIGPAEIYNVVEKIEGIADSMAIGQNWEGDQRIILFVRLATGYELTDELKTRIKTALRKQASPRHVPSLIFQAPEIPYTFNTKKVESSVANIFNGRPVTNRDAITNPESLNFYEQIAFELHQ